MDDQKRLLIRDAFTSRFWRLIFGIVLLTGFLLWLWFLVDKHRYFYWLTLLPLLFIMPLVRYHLAIRSLTEPESTGGQAPAVIYADTLAKSRIRRRAKVVIAIVDVLLILLLVGSLWNKLEGESSHEDDLKYRLGNAKFALSEAFREFAHQNARDIALFTPPANPNDYASWAASIERHVQQPVAVFLRENKRIEWVSRPEEIAILDSLFAAKWSEIESKPVKPWSQDSLGSVIQHRFSYGERSDPMYNVVHVFQRIGEPLAWGVVLRREHAWRPYFARLRAGTEREENDPWDDIAVRAGTIVQVQRIVILGREWSSFPVLRASLDGEELFRSPGFDTSGVSLVDTVDLARLEFYSSRQDNMVQETWRKDRIPWGRVIIILVTLSVLHLCWLWIRKLTASA